MELELLRGELLAVIVDFFDVLLQPVERPLDFFLRHLLRTTDDLPLVDMLYIHSEELLPLV